MTIRLERRAPGATTDRSHTDPRGTWTIDPATSTVAFARRTLRRWTSTGRRPCLGVIHLDALPPVALDDLSFTVREGQLFGFVGPNGAGKTTAMRIILGVLEPNAGEVRWRGQPMNDEIRKQIGYLPEDYRQTFSTQCARIRGTAAATLCQLSQQPQHPPTAPPCRCGKAERHAREEQPAIQVRRRQVALNAQAMFAFQAQFPPVGRAGASPGHRC